MGKGKGSVHSWVFPVGPGRILFEIQGSFPKSLAKDVLTSASLKLPLLTKFVSYDSSFNPL